MICVDPGFAQSLLGFAGRRNKVSRLCTCKLCFRRQIKSHSLSNLKILKLSTKADVLHYKEGRDGEKCDDVHSSQMQQIFASVGFEIRSSFPRNDAPTLWFHKSNFEWVNMASKDKCKIWMIESKCPRSEDLSCNLLLLMISSQIFSGQF